MPLGELTEPFPKNHSPGSALQASALQALPRPRNVDLVPTSLPEFTNWRECDSSRAADSNPRRPTTDFMQHARYHRDCSPRLWFEESVYSRTDWSKQCYYLSLSDTIYYLFCQMISSYSRLTTCKTFQWCELFGRVTYRYLLVSRVFLCHLQLLCLQWVIRNFVFLQTNSLSLLCI